MKPTEFKFQAIAGQYDVGREFTFQGEKYKIIKFKSKATKNPFISQNIRTGQKFLIPLTDYILKQIRKGEVTDIK